jgi:hypothetical protein
MCAIGGWTQPKMTSLLAILPDGIKHPDGMNLFDTVKEKLPLLRKATNECPACMLASLRQAHLGGELYMDSFDFTKETKEFFYIQNNKENNNY